MSATGWIEQSGNAPKRKRAGLVCVACHEKKIKCDLQRRDNTGCSHCISAGQECRVRASKRGGNHRNSQHPRPSDASSQPAALSQPTEDDGAALCTPPESTANERVHFDYPQPATLSRVNEAYPRYTPGGNYLYPMAPVVPDETPTTSHIGPLLGTDRSVSSPQSTRTSNPNPDPYLNESGFLQVYSQEHRNYTNGEGRTPEGESLSQDIPDPDLMQSFMETYFKSCYAWCPVLDRETLVGELAESPLLLNAIALAGSHIRPPLIPSTSPAIYYNRAKKMFYGDEEADSIRCLQAVCLFYWWSPRPSSQLQKDSAWWWTAASIRQAQQIGLHREVRPSNVAATTLDRGLRRRVWWTLFVSNVEDQSHTSFLIHT
jgi:hypothetical protein